MSFGNIQKDSSYTNIRVEKSASAKSVCGLFSGNVRQNGSLVQFEQSPGNWITTSGTPLPVTQVGPTVDEPATPPGVPFGMNEIALSGDGSVLAYCQSGLVRMYSIVNNVATPGQSLVPNDIIPSPNPDLKPTCGLSADGKTLAYGYYADDGGTGAAWVFNNVGGTWVQTTEKLIGFDSRYTVDGSFGQFGTNVFMSADGNTMAVAAPTATPASGPDVGNLVGLVFVFTQALPGVWTQQGQGLVGAGYESTSALNSYFMALSSDGNTIASIGFFASKVWIFKRNAAGVWNEIAIDYPDPGYFLSGGISLSGDGSTLALGGGLFTTSEVSILEQSGVGAYKLNQILALPRTAVGMSGFATYLQYSASGSYLAVSSPLDDTGRGAVFLFSRNGDGNYLFNRQIKANGVSLNFGIQVVMGQEETSLAVYSPNNSVGGSVWLFK